jgi:HEAT repeat protein
MKLLITTLLITTFLLSSLNAAPNPKISKSNKQNTISSLMIGLKSDNLGLKSSSAYMIGELKMSEAIIPLMNILRENENEELRIAAALALYKIGTPMAIHAVKQSIRFDESTRVSTLCSAFYSEYLKIKFNDEEKNKDLVETARK